MEFISPLISRPLPKAELHQILEKKCLPAPPIREYHLQRLWFEEWFINRLQINEGEEITIIQTGIWNHSAGPDFTHAAYRDSTGKIHFGPVEVHLDANDWKNHGHHLDARYNDVILHLVWKSTTHPTITRDGKIIPQVELSRFLSFPPSDLSSLFPETPPLSALTTKPGLCHHALTQSPDENQWKLVEEAGWLRMLQKSRRLFLRQQILGATQTLWEALAEGCGYSRNTLPFRSLAQRLRATNLIGLPASSRKALLLGVAGFLPQEIHLSPHQNNSLQSEARTVWEHWWRAQSSWSHAILPSHVWQLHGVRPWNRPERRIAALARIIPRLRAIKEQLQKNQWQGFGRELSHLNDPFWETHTTWNSRAQKASPLLGSERIHDLEINCFWPWQIAKNGPSIQAQLTTLRMNPNQKTTLAWARIGGTSKIPLSKQTILFQQGLLHLLHDFCFRDTSHCQSCPFPALIQSHRLHEHSLPLPLSTNEYRAYLQSEIKTLENEITREI